MKLEILSMMEICGDVALVNSRGVVVFACSVAVGNIGVYDNHGRYYSFVTLECDTFVPVSK